MEAPVEGSEDPVCGMVVSPETAVAAWEHEGTVYLFCSVGCMTRFRRDPERFLGLDPEERGMDLPPEGM
jgi:P-type Cu+ transporter